MAEKLSILLCEDDENLGMLLYIVVKRCSFQGTHFTSPFRL